MSIAVDIIRYGSEYVVKHTRGIIIVVTTSASAALVTRVITKKEDHKILLREKASSYKAGIRKGRVLNKRVSQIMLTNHALAHIAVAYYMARIDGNISKDEKRLLDAEVKSLIQGGSFNDSFIIEVEKIKADKKIDFVKVREYLDKIDVEAIEKLLDVAYSIADANGEVTASETKALNLLGHYVLERENAIDDDIFSVEDVLFEEEVEKAVNEYTWRMKLLDSTFEQRVKLNKREISLLMFATCLHCLRIYGVNYFTEIEKANKGKKEKFLHKQQEKLLEGFGRARLENPKPYYAPINQIVFGRGVPYDATKYVDKSLALFKGANHRFSTLGHDPLLGILVGTANIMTNTITIKSDKTIVPMTYHVEYDSNLKNPIITKPATLAVAINTIIERTEEDIEPLIAALIKQLMHIATDLYTPAGIQLPGAGLVMSKKNVELLTSYISTGDLIKLQTSSAIEHLIDKIISIIHGCILLEKGKEIDSKINQVKCRKIITYSKAISSGSNLIEKMMTQQYKGLDINGLFSLLIGLFSNNKFLYDVKYEFIRNGLGEE